MELDCIFHKVEIDQGNRSQ